MQNKNISPINDLYEIVDGDMLSKDFSDPFSESATTHYMKDALDILTNDKKHYDKFYNYLNTIYPNFKELFFDTIYSFGGGMPKFESYLKPEKIVVFDGNTEVYIQTQKHFKQLYNYKNTLEFIQCIITKNLIKNIDISSDKRPLFTFVHFLEHLSLVDHLDILCNLPKNVEVIIYNPNVEVAVNKNWWHFKPIDHNSFIPLSKLKKILIQLDYKIIKSTSYIDDLFIYFLT